MENVESTDGIFCKLFLILRFESLKDLDQSFEKLGSKLTVFRGNPKEIFEMLFSSKKVKNLFYEKDTEPYAKTRDKIVSDLCSKNNIQIHSFLGHTLYDPEDIIKNNGGKAPLQYSKLQTIIKKLPKIQECVRDPSKSEIIPFKDIDGLLKLMKYKGDITIPCINELNHKNENNYEKPTALIKGGETEALKIMKEYLKDKKKAANFEKPKTSPVAFNPVSTTTLSPFLKFGCLSVRKFYFELNNILKEIPNHSQPPCSLLGQLYWREFFYCASVGVPNFNKMEGNPICKQIDWLLNNPNDEDEKGKKYLNAWSEGMTGYPWIDAIMKQLRQEGWIHHLARHCVACFLTRGDLYVNWERGMEVFEELLLDADYALNAGNWLWLSGTSSFFSAYFRMYSPVAFPKKYDPDGKYVRKYLPVLKDMPKEFIYEPWKAPKSVQEKVGCVIGIDYPERIVDHDVKNNFYLNLGN